jgi:3-hydroxyisobutyrate dehydrogenase-like beta-hydroxyacid dehydrogenase
LLVTRTTECAVAPRLDAVQKTPLGTTLPGQTDLDITRVGFGAWAIGGGGWEFGWGPQDDDDSIHHALDLGVNWIDRGEGLTMTTPTIGFVGLGHMGGSMAARLLSAGYAVHGMNRTRRRADELIANGLNWHDTPREVAEAADVVLTSVPDDEALNLAAAGPDGILAGLNAGTTWADVSTVSPTVSREMAARVRALGATMLDAPVSGSVPQVRAGTLTIMVGGDADAYDRVEPVLRELGTPRLIGSNGQGLVLKLAINISLAVQMLALAEGLLLADRSGIDRPLALEVMTGSAVGSPMLKARAPLVLDPPAEAWFALGLVQKDIELARDVAEGLGVPLPTADRTDEILGLARTLGYERCDLAALFQVLEQVTRERRTAA